MDSSGKLLLEHVISELQSAAEKIKMLMELDEPKPAPRNSPAITKYVIAEAVRKHEPEIKEAEASRTQKKEEKRIDLDAMGDPPISSQIVADVAGFVEQVSGRLNGQNLNCIVLGKYTGAMAVAISDSLGGAGGRVLCIGDCLDSDNRPLKEWLDVVGDRFRSTAFPVAGDIEDTFQDTERPIDMILFSTCGGYADMASLISKWAGLVRPGGMVCGTQLDESDYRASSDAIMDIFGEDRVKRSENSTCWNVKIGVGAKA